MSIEGIDKKIYEYKGLEIRNGKALLGNLVRALASSWDNVVSTAFSYRGKSVSYKGKLGLWDFYSIICF